MYIDHSVYPDYADPPDRLETDGDRADYVHRICTAWDFHIPPKVETCELFRGWREIFDRYPVLTSPGYHAFRAYFGWPRLVNPLPGRTPMYVHMDRLEGRDEGPC